MQTKKSKWSFQNYLETLHTGMQSIRPQEQSHTGTKRCRSGRKITMALGSFLIHETDVINTSMNGFSKISI